MQVNGVWNNSSNYGSVNNVVRIDGLIFPNVSLKSDTELLTKLQPITILTATGGLKGGFGVELNSSISTTLPYYLRMAGGSPDGKDYQVSLGLSWDDDLNPHGDFTLNTGESFTINNGLIRPWSPKSSWNWNGTTLNKYGEGTLILNGDNNYSMSAQEQTIVAGVAL